MLIMLIPTLYQIEKTEKIEDFRRFFSVEITIEKERKKVKTFSKQMCIKRALP